MKRFINTVLAPILALALTAAPVHAVSLQPVDPAQAAIDAKCRTIVSERRVRGNAFYVGARSPGELADIVQASLREDETGMTVVRPAKAGDRAYARPMDYFCAVRQTDADAVPAQLRSLADLPAYLRSLVESQAPRGRYVSWCITQFGARPQCVTRSFHEGETAWVNARTAKIVFKRDCTNPVDGPEVKDCYVFSYNYREERAVRMIEGRASVSTHFVRLTQEEFARMYADECYFVQDADGRRKPEPNCPTLYCPPGSAWPEVRLAQAVGLPGEPPMVTIHFQLRDGQGNLSVPSWVIDKLGNVIPCVVTVPYPVSVTGYRGWRAVARFDIAVQETILQSRSSGRYPHPFVGERHY